MDDEAATGFAETLAAKYEPVIIRITPERVVTYDYRKASRSDDARPGGAPARVHRVRLPWASCTLGAVHPRGGSGLVVEGRRTGGGPSVLA